MGITPKGSNVTPITRRGGGRKSLGYDPEKDEVNVPKGYQGPTLDSDAESDVFKVVDPHKYREDRFYTRSVNASHHGEKLSIRVPQGIDSQMHAAVGVVAEYNSIHDLIRDAVVHRLEFLQKRYKLSEGARRMLELERIQAEMEARTQESQSMAGAVKNLEEKLQGFWDEGDFAMLAEELDKGSELYEWMREPFRGRTVAMITRWKGVAREEIAKMLEERD